MTTPNSDPSRELLSFVDLDDPGVTPESFGVRVYEFSVVDTFPSAVQAHKDQLDTLAESTGKGPLNPAAIEEDPSLANTSPLSQTTPAKIEQQRKARDARNRRYRPRRDTDYFAEPR